MIATIPPTKLFIKHDNIASRLKDASLAKESGHFEYAVEIYSDLSKRNVPEAHYLLAVMLNEGLGIDIDHSRALNLLGKALNLGWTAANAELGKMLCFGLGAEINLYQARDYLEKAPDDPTALFLLGLLYRDGDSVEPDQTKAIHYFERAALLNNTLACSELVGIYTSKQDLATASIYREKAVELGDPHSLNSRGMEYLHKRDKDTALDYIRRAAELGIQGAWDTALNIEISQVNADVFSDQEGKFRLEQSLKDEYQELKQYYKTPHQLRQNDLTGWEIMYSHFIRAAVVMDPITSSVKKDAIAFYNLGMMHLEGRGTSKSLWNGLSYLEEAAELHDKRAAQQLRKIVEQGYGAHSAEDVIACYREAALQKEPWALCRLGVWHSRQLCGFEKDIKQALIYLDEAESLGIEGAKRHVDWICQQGSDKPNIGDVNNLFIHFSEEAKKGNPRAHYRLSRVYLMGFGFACTLVKKDYELAAYHLKKAVELGHKDRERLLEWRGLQPFLHAGPTGIIC